MQINKLLVTIVGNLRKKYDYTFLSFVHVVILLLIHVCSLIELVIQLIEFALLCCMLLVASSTKFLQFNRNICRYHHVNML